MPATLTAAPPASRLSLDPQRLARAKAAYTTRRIPFEPGTALLSGPDVAPRIGDVVLARVTALGQHPRIERPDGRRAALFVGDEVIVCYGNRYAPDQFEAEMPEDLGLCDLVAAGGLAARALSRHSKMGQPTRLDPVGLLCHPSGRRMNLADWALPPAGRRQRDVPVYAVAGTSMNAGKSTTLAGLIRGLTNSGFRVGAAKVTGTGAGGDVWLMSDAGADPVLDFTAAGMPSTYLASPDAIEQCMDLVVGHLVAAGVDVVVFEVADGIYQPETRTLLSSPRFEELIDGMIYCAGDAGGAAAGLEWLSDLGLPVIGVSGLLTASPLAIREAAELVDVPVFDLNALGGSEIAAALQSKGVAQVA